MNCFIELGGNLRAVKRVVVAFMVFSVLIMAFVPSSLFAFGQSPTSYIHGYVVDEDGEVLSDVAVELVSGGVIVASTFTNSYGYFSMGELERGTYTLYLKKLGYVEVTKTVVLTSSESDLGTTVMSRTLTLSTSTLSLVSSPGRQITIVFTARNAGSVTEAVDFSVSNPDGWKTRILDQNYEIKKLSIASGQSMSLKLEVTIPSNASIGQDYNVSVDASGLINATLNFTILTRSEPSASVSGTLIDNFDNPIQDATVNAYLADGSLIQTVTTSTNGRFSIVLPIDTSVVIHFSKTGYVAASKSVSLVATTENLELGEVLLAKSLSLATSILNTVANPGEKLLLPFDLSNDGEDQEIVQFSVTKPDTWSTRVLDQNGREIKNVVLASGASLSLQLEVTIPVLASGDKNLTLTAIGQTTSALDFMFYIEPSSESTLSCQFPGQLAMPGDPVTFVVTLTNPFGVETRFKLSTDSMPINWTSSIKANTGEYVTELILGAGESATFEVEVNSPTSASTEENYEFSVNAESNGQTLDSLLLAVSLVEPEAIEEIAVTTKFPEVTVEAGELVEYQISLGNFGDSNRLLYLSIDAPADWKAVFKSGTLEITQLDISPMSIGGAEDLVIEVTPPSSVALGTYSIPVQIKSETGLVLAEIELKATIVGSFKLTLSPSTLLTSTTSGESASFTATVRNTGYSTLNIVDLDIEVEDGWSVEISPAQVDLLRPQESAKFTVNIATPSDTVSGDYLVTLTASSDQVDSSSVQVRITVNTSTSWGIYGFGVAAFIIIVLVLVFRKFKRR